jgi:glycosyltransferase involved in cell wall biosynthesis
MLKRWVDAFVAPSAFVGRMLVRSGLPAERVHVIHNGVPLEVASGDPKEPRVAVFAGRLSTEKGLHVLLDAARYVPSVRLVIAGDGPLCGVVHERRLPNVKYLGRLEQRELSALRKHAVFTVLPSLSYDVSPSSAIESLAAGVPVIASDIGGIPEIIHHEETGLLVERDNAKQLAEAMLQLWDDDGQRRLLGEQGRRFIGNEYGADRQVERLVELYGGLLAA